RRRCVSAVAVRVTGRVIELRPDLAVVRDSHVTGPDELVGALERRVVCLVGGVPELARNVDVMLWQAARVCERRMLGPDHGVDDADDDTLTGVPGVPGLLLTVETEEVGGDIRLLLLEHVLLDTDHTLGEGELLRLRLGEVQSDCVDSDSELGPWNLSDAGALQSLLLLLLEVGAVLLDVVGVGVDLLPRSRLGPRNALHSAVVPECR